MAKTCTLHVRMEPKVKENAEKVLNDLGITSSEAINLFYEQICIQMKLPFSTDLNNSKKVKSKKKSLSGYLSKYANKDLISQEDGIWEREVLSKWS